VPAYELFLPQPPMELTPEKEQAFENLFLSTPKGELIDYHLPYPKWQHLSWLCATKELVLHGSQNQEIGVVEPQQARDIRDFSNQEAIYATTDGIWVIYFAIIDRKKFKGLNLFNSCVQVRNAEGQWSEPNYFFSVSHFARIQKPWCEGMIYILPRQTFEQEAHQQAQGMEIALPHWISHTAAHPVARLVVGPQDFPFLDQIHGHDDEKVAQLYQTDPDGFPWHKALIS
jgi:hypothetical protein